MPLNNSHPHGQAQAQELTSTATTVTESQGLAERRRFVRGFPSVEVLEDNSDDSLKTFLALLHERRSDVHSN